MKLPMITARHLRTLEKEQRCSTPGQILLLSVAIGLTTPFAQAQPANDLFANRISISGTNCVVTASSVGANKEAGEPYHAGMTGGASVWWSWTAPSSGTVSISTAGSSFDTLLGIYTGSILSLLTEVASNDDEDYPTIYTSQVVFDVTAGQTYQIAVDGYGAEAGSVRVSLQLGP